MKKYAWLAILLSIMLPSLLVGSIMIKSGLMNWGIYVIMMAGYISTMVIGYYNLYAQLKQKTKEKTRTAKDILIAAGGIACSLILLVIISSWYWGKAPE